MKKIRLYGEWGKRFGREFELDVKTPAEAIRALCTQVKGFREFVHSQAQNKVSIFMGRRNITQDEVALPSSGDVIRIVPVLEGSGGGKGTNWAMIIVGVILVAMSWGTNMSGWQMIGMGLGMSLISAGVSGLLAKPPPKLTVSGETEARDSFAFGGPVNTTQQGNPVPVCYGKMIVGSQVISLGLVTH